MSIWSSTHTIGHDPTPWAADKTPDPPNGDVRSYSDGWSNHYPVIQIETPAAIHLAVIPPYCVPGNDEPECDYRAVGPWLRIEVDCPEALTWWKKTPEGNPTHQPEHATCVLNEEAAHTLRDALTEWLQLPKARPR